MKDSRNSGRLPTHEGLTMNIFARFLKNESGATAIEYGLIAGLIAVAIIAAVGLVGTDVTAVFQTIADKLPTAA
jgi:pilus assembly protein Flp/PilA